ncbi:MAG TPA: site-specific DNA-methyltransferase [Candidatus Polarisedimenticolia bacterium]|nr:site-specific DNA-methyltransferase [Candidatus Polarisedimenticolia bacterium]
MQRWGTGALNVDACRLPFVSDTFPRRRNVRIFRTGSGGQHVVPAHLGRWPANVCLDNEAAELLDALVGPQRSGGTPSRRFSDKTRNAYGRFRGEENPNGIGSSAGTVSRFFYCPKASRTEREAGCEVLPARNAAEALRRAEGSDGLKSPRAGAGRTAVTIRNFHPTVKPLALMCWLARLVTPPDGLVLDPFAGSGSTGCASMLEGCRFIGIEREVEYTRIARGRLRYWNDVAFFVSRLSTNSGSLFVSLGLR